MEYLIKTKSIGGMTEEQFFQFCQENDSLKMERNAMGEIILMEPAGTYTGAYNLGITAKLYEWNASHKLGITFDSNTGFTLPNKAVRSPDGAFISKERWEKIPVEDRKKFAHICPDFVIELLSESDTVSAVRKKMKEWIDNGCRLAWMIVPVKKETWIYHKNGQVEIKPFSSALSGGNVLPGFTLDLQKIFTEE
jgi:Uma2 family endonuclease